MSEEDGFLEAVTACLARQKRHFEKATLFKQAMEMLIVGGKACASIILYCTEDRHLCLSQNLACTSKIEVQYELI